MRPEARATLSRRTRTWKSVRVGAAKGILGRGGGVREGWLRLRFRLGRIEDARVKLVSGAKAGCRLVFRANPVYNSRTAPSGRNPRRTFHPNHPPSTADATAAAAINHPLSPLPNRPSLPPTLSPGSPGTHRFSLLRPAFATARLRGGCSLRS